jgi:DNA-binding MarR family transcriptional regulator
LKKLEKKGLVTRTRSAQDERSVIITITEPGLALKQEALDFLPSLLCSSCLSPQELTDLRDLVRRLVEGLSQ